MQLTIVLDTWLKARPVLSSELSSQEKVLIPARQVFEVHSHMAVGNHVRVAFKDTTFGPQNRNTWYCWKDAVSIEGNEPNNHPVDVAPMAVEAGKKPVLPGNQIVTLNSPILPGGHFTWAEATHDGSRLLAVKLSATSFASRRRWKRFDRDWAIVPSKLLLGIDRLILTVLSAGHHGAVTF